MNSNEPANEPSREPPDESQSAPPNSPGPAAPAAHQRRPRYRGTHPRHFQEKYKELQPGQYPETVARVIASGKTPAGMHRPVMLAEVIEALAPRPGEFAVDCTLGYGGHASGLWPQLQPGGRLLGIDTDPLELPKTEARLRAAGFSDQFQVRQTNFAALKNVLSEPGLTRADIILADLGVSSMQLDDPARGFSHKWEGPLDLRLNPRKGRTAAEALATITAGELRACLRDFSDEARADEIAAAIIAERSLRPLRTTAQLAGVVRGALSPGRPRDAAERSTDAIRRLFQALRILVNDEFGVLEHFLRVLPECLQPGGRAAILTFHSGEDRRVKRAFQEGWREGLYETIAETPVRPSAAETGSNPRASSAKLRWARRSQLE